MVDFLVLGSLVDPHVGRVIDRLTQWSVSCEVMDHENSMRSSFHVQEDGQYHLVVNGRKVPASALVWDRVKLMMASRQPDEEDAVRRWRMSEWNINYRAVAEIWSDNVLNPPFAKGRMSKPTQQIVAASVGFKAPETLVSNNRTDILEFVERNPSIIKSLGTATLPAGGSRKSQIVMTMPLKPERMAQTDDAHFIGCPHLIQKNIEKSHELRIVIVDRKIFAFKIDSQALASSKTDWREEIYRLQYEPCTLDSSLEDKLLSLMEGLGVFSGSIDLIVDPQGQHWFLECNQDGQWAWLDDILEGAIADAFARGFLDRIRARRAH